MSSHVIFAQMHFNIGWLSTFALLAAMNFFLLWHLIATAFKRRKRAKTIIFVVSYLSLAAVFVIYFTGFFAGKSSEAYMQPLSYVAGFFLCIFFYLSVAFFCWDIARICVKLVRFFRGGRKNIRSDAKDESPFLGEHGAKRRETKRNTGRLAVFNAKTTLAIISLCAALSLCAFYAPLHIKATHYDIEIDRRSSESDRLKTVMISDMHIGSAIREKQIDEIVSMTNAEAPDLVIFAGDIFDEGTQRSLKEYASERFSEIRAKYGAYLILGNHDDYKGDTSEVLAYFERAGIKCLPDEVALVENRFYIVGREDRRSGRRGEFEKMRSLLTKDLPVILADHRPVTDKSAIDERIQLQLSGHTHGGQIFPARLFDPITRSLSYGLYRRGAQQIIVSSGAGEFAVPVRLGSPAEIAVVDIHLK